jgi:hypothetical protein
MGLTNSDVLLSVLLVKILTGDEDYDVLQKEQAR